MLRTISSRPHDCAGGFAPDQFTGARFCLASIHIVAVTQGDTSSCRPETTSERRSPKGEATAGARGRLDARERVLGSESAAAETADVSTSGRRGFMSAVKRMLAVIAVAFAAT